VTVECTFIVLSREVYEDIERDEVGKQCLQSQALLRKFYVI